MDTWKKWLPGCPVDWRFRTPEAGGEAGRPPLLAALDDCHGPGCDRLRWRLHTAERAQELWLLRDQIFQAVVIQHCLQQAEQRSDSLVAAFRSAVPTGLWTQV